LGGKGEGLRKRRSRKKGNYGGKSSGKRVKMEKDLRTDKGGWWENLCVGGMYI
jgi:hypothetical protein